MFGKKQTKEILEHLEKAQNPVFYYDNDADGLCAFLILRRFLGRGYGVAVRSYPDLNETYLKKAEQLNADYIFVLDKPIISKEFVEGADKMQLPLVWIDHHDMVKASAKEFLKHSNFHLYNSCLAGEKSNEPTSYLAYKIARRKEDIWIAMIGCIADHYLPDFSDEFAKRYPEFWNKKAKKPFDAYFGSEIGRIALALNFGLKDSITNVVNMQNFLISCKNPGEVFLELETNKSFREKFREIEKKYNELLKKSEESESGKAIYLVYSGELSISSDLSNNLSYLYPEKFIVVAYKKGQITNISMRGKNVKAILEKILENLENATGGGHKNAVGARIKTEDFQKFKEIFEKEI